MLPCGDRPPRRAEQRDWRAIRLRRPAGWPWPPREPSADLLPAVGAGGGLARRGGCRHHRVVRRLPILLERHEAVVSRWQGSIAELLPEGLAAAARAAHAAMEVETRRALSRGPALTPACAAGCSWCCHVHADASVPEILAAAAHLRRARSPEALSALRERLAEQAARVTALDDQERWAQRIPCALLAEDGRCSIYEARPLRCRAFHSCAVEPCRDALDGVRDAEAVASPPLTRASAAVEEAYDRALVQAGLSPEGYRFELGLLIALDDPGAGERWRAGEDAFAAARPQG